MVGRKRRRRGWWSQRMAPGTTTPMPSPGKGGRGGGEGRGGGAGGGGARGGGQGEEWEESWCYIPGAGDDEESWARGLTPALFWAHLPASPRGRAGGMPAGWLRGWWEEESVRTAWQGPQPRGTGGGKRPGRGREGEAVGAGAGEPADAGAARVQMGQARLAPEESAYAMPASRAARAAADGPCGAPCWIGNSRSRSHRSTVGCANAWTEDPCPGHPARCFSEPLWGSELQRALSLCGL